MIYKIENKINNKIYIGITNNFKRRINSHFNDKSGYLLKRAITKYGKENFTVSLLEKVSSQEDAFSKEKNYIKKYNSKKPNGYNLTNGGEGTFGRKMSEKQKEGLRIFHTGRKLSKETIEKIRAKHLGTSRSSETKAKMSDAAKGENSSQAKLNWAKVDKIRELFKTGKYTYSSLGRKFLVTPEMISHIIRNKNWVNDNYYPDFDLIKKIIKERRKELGKLSSIYNIGV